MKRYFFGRTRRPESCCRSTLARQLRTMGRGLTNYPRGPYNDLHRAVAMGSVKRTLGALGIVVDINAPSNPTADTPLTIASSMGDLRLVKILVDRGADTERVTHVGRSALFGAVSYPEVARFLLGCGANHGVSDVTGTTPLHVAASGERHIAGQAVLMILLEHGANPDVADIKGHTPLHLVVHRDRPASGRVDVAKMLIENGANVNASSENGCTPLHDICVYLGGRDETALVTVAQILVEHGANPNAANKYGSTPLHLLATGESPLTPSLLNVAKLLIERGADVNATNCNRSTPLHVACVCAKRLALVKNLLNSGANVDVTDVAGETSLHLASAEGLCAVVSVIIGAGAMIDLRDQRGATALVRAVEGGHVLAAKMLLRADANLLLPVFAAGTWKLPLDIAAGDGRADITEELLANAGIDSCGGPSRGMDALMAATEKDRTDIISLLLDAGVVDNGDCLRSAIREGNIRSLQILLDRREGDIKQYVASEKAGDVVRSPIAYCFEERALSPSSRRAMRLLLDVGADTRMHGIHMIKDTERAVASLVQYADYLISDWKTLSECDQRLVGLKALRHLLIQREAVSASSWLWSAAAGYCAPSVAKTSSTALTAMIPLLRRRPARRRGLLSAMLRWVVCLDAGLYFARAVIILY